MNLGKKTELAARTLKVGKERITFIDARKSDIKEAITKQDIKDLVADGAILVKEVKGRKTVTKRKNRKGAGNIKKKVNTRKRDYVIMTRKLRKYVAEMKKQGVLNPEEVSDIRKKIRNKIYKSYAHLKTYVRGLKE